jgi:hypothetical protein
VKKFSQAICWFHSLRVDYFSMSQISSPIAHSLDLIPARRSMLVGLDHNDILRFTVRMSLLTDDESHHKDNNRQRSAYTDWAKGSVKVLWDLSLQDELTIKGNAAKVN